MDLAKIIFKLKGPGRTTFFSPTGEWSLPVPSVILPEEKEFAADECASMHMLSRKDLHCAALETVKVSKSTMKVVTANGEVQRKEEATACVKEVDLFVTVKLLEDTPGVNFLLGKTLRTSWV